MLIDIEEKSYDAIINALLSATKERQAAFSFWLLPPFENENIIIDLYPSIGKTSLDSLIRDSRKGFVLHPFSGIDADRGILCINADGIMEKEAESRYRISWNEDADRKSVMSFSKSLQYHLDCTTAQRHVSEDGALPLLEEDQQKINFLDLVTQGKTAIENHFFDKVVLSRRMCKPLPKWLSWSRLFEILSDSYPKTLISLVATPQFGVWVGASPEIILHIDADNIAHVDSLAGTIIKPTNDKAASGWKEKERHEQHLVSRFIGDVFRDTGIHAYRKSDLATCTMGFLEHLKERWEFDLNHPENNISIDKLIYDLHPTPAICGLPKRPAFDFIRRKEGFDRSLFAGFLGPVNFDTKLALYVNIRCMRIFSEHALIYAGAGITAASDPMAEWRETEAKCAIMANALEKITGTGEIQSNSQ